MKQDVDFVFFGTPEFSAIILDELAAAGYTPFLIITAPDRPVGRKQIITPPAVKVWANSHGIECWQPKHPRDIADRLAARGADLFIVASYGYILSQTILNIPTKGVLNVHTSLLPKYRGASPIESALLNGDTETGSTIMQMTLGMDEGPIITQSRFNIEPDMVKPDLFTMLAHDGGRLLAEILPDYVSGKGIPVEQDHNKASYCGKIEKSDGDITNDDDQTRWRKYRAYYGWPGVFVWDGDIRLKITSARYQDDTFIIEKIIPAGSNEIDYQTYLAKKS